MSYRSYINSYINNSFDIIEYSKFSKWKQDKQYICDGIQGSKIYQDNDKYYIVIDTQEPDVGYIVLTKNKEK